MAGKVQYNSKTVNPIIVWREICSNIKGNSPLLRTYQQRTHRRNKLIRILHTQPLEDILPFRAHPHKELPSHKRRLQKDLRNLPEIQALVHDPQLLRLQRPSKPRSLSNTLERIQRLSYPLHDVR